MKHLLVAVVALLVPVGLVACSDDGSTVRDGESASASGSASAVASGSEPAECDPVGDRDDIDATVDIELDEWSIAAPDTVEAGNLHFAATNAGDEIHELVIVRADSVADVPRNDDGDPDEEAIAEDDFIGEIEGIAPGETCGAVFDLEPADYVLFCAIVEDHDGETISHFQEGMNRALTVE